MSKAEFTRTENGMTVTIEGQEYSITVYPTMKKDTIPPMYMGKYSDLHNFTLTRDYVPTKDKQRELYNQFKRLYTCYADLTLGRTTESAALLLELLWKNNIELTERYCYIINDVRFRDDIIKADISKVVAKFLNKEIDIINIENIDNEIKLRCSDKIRRLPIKSPYLKEKILNLPNFWNFSKESLDNIVKWQTRLTKDFKRTDHIIEEIERFKKTIPHYLQDYIFLTDSYNYINTKKFKDVLDYIALYEDIDNIIYYLHTVWNDNPMTYSELRTYRDTLNNQLKDIRAKEKEAKFTNRQSKLNNVWDNNEYKIIIPLTKDDCIKIGNKFGNCFGDLEWGEFLAEGHRYGACIVDKNNKPIICLDIDIHTKQIIQYLAPHNKVIRDEALLQLKEEIRTVILKNIINE